MAAHLSSITERSLDIYVEFSKELDNISTGRKKNNDFIIVAFGAPAERTLRKTAGLKFSGATQGTRGEFWLAQGNARLFLSLVKRMSESRWRKMQSWKVSVDRYWQQPVPLTLSRNGSELTEIAEW
jgi:hypothetical protein